MLALRTDANERFFAAAAEPLARLCHLVAERFWSGGRLIAIGHSPQARSDARHVAVEFVHPVIVGKRALPARALTGEQGALREQVELDGRAPGHRDRLRRGRGDRRLRWPPRCAVAA